MGRYVLSAVLIGLLMMTPTCPAAPVEGDHDLSFVLSNLTALWEEVRQLRHEVEDQRRGDSPHDQATREVDVMKHEELVHHYYRPHEGHNDHHDPALLQHLEHSHNHTEDTHDHSRDHHHHHHHHRGHHHIHSHPHNQGHHHHHHHHRGHDHHHQNDTTHDHAGHGHSRDDHRHAKQDDEDHDQSGEDENSSEEKENSGHDHSGDDHDHSGDDRDHSGDDRDHSGDDHSTDHHHHHDEGHDHSHYDHDDHHDDDDDDHHHHHHGKDAHDRHGLHTPPKGASLPRPVVAGSVLVPKIGLALIPGRGGPQAAADQEDEWMHAICSLEPNADVENGTVRGTVVISQKKDESGPVFFHINIDGFKPSDGLVHGFHVHESPVSDNNCVTAGSHLNPFGTHHGGPDSEIRHVGDLGNIVVDSDGKLENYILSDNVVAFKGPASIIGKSIVVHAGEDDLGLGGNESSLTTGNAGGRLACCNIHIQAETLYRFKG